MSSAKKIRKARAAKKRAFRLVRGMTLHEVTMFPTMWESLFLKVALNYMKQRGLISEASSSLE